MSYMDRIKEGSSYFPTPMYRYRQRLAANEASRKLPNNTRASINDVKLAVARGIRAYKRREVEADKTIELRATATPVAQVNQDNNGAYSLDITPLPSQDASDNGRIGTEVKLSKLQVSLQLMPTNPAVFAHDMRVTYDIWHVKGLPIDIADANRFYTDALVGSGLIDATSQLNADYTQTVQATRVASFKAFLRAPDIQPTGATGGVVSAFVRKTIKLKHKIRFAGDTTTVTSGQLILMARADTGNRSSTTDCTLNVPTKKHSSGANWNHELKYYYSDA